MADTIKEAARGFERQTGAARLAVLVASVALLASLALVALDRLFLPERFAVREVVVTGDAPNVDPAAVLAAVRSLGQRSWFSVDLEEVERAVRSVPWVYRAWVRRRWPGKLVVTVAQAEPFARWNEGQWINDAGEILHLPAGFSGERLPTLGGPEGSAGEVVLRYRELAALFVGDHPAAPRSLRLDSRGAFEMGVVARADADGRIVEIRIGRERLVERVSRLAAALRTGLGSRLHSVASIDLRYPNGFAVTFVDGESGAGMAQSAPRPKGGNTG